MILSGRLRVTTVLHCDDTIELLELLIDDLLAHGIANTITIDKDMAR